MFGFCWATVLLYPSKYAMVLHFLRLHEKARFTCPRGVRLTDETRSNAFDIAFDITHLFEIAQ